MPKEKEAVVKDKAPRQTASPDFLVQAWRRGGFLPYDAAAVAAKTAALGQHTKFFSCCRETPPQSFLSATE